jgi:hypothetical protein
MNRLTVNAHTELLSGGLNARSDAARMPDQGTTAFGCGCGCGGGCGFVCDFDLGDLELSRIK